MNTSGYKRMHACSPHRMSAWPGMGACMAMACTLNSGITPLPVVVHVAHQDAVHHMLCFTAYCTPWHAWRMRLPRACMHAAVRARTCRPRLFPLPVAALLFLLIRRPRAARAGPASPFLNYNHLPACLPACVRASVCPEGSASGAGPGCVIRRGSGPDRLGAWGPASFPGRFALPSCALLPLAADSWPGCLSCQRAASVCRMMFRGPARLRVLPLSLAQWWDS